MKNLLPVVCDVASPVDELSRSSSAIIVCIVIIVIAIVLIAMRAAIKNRKDKNVSEADANNIAVAKKESNDKTE